jgi:hypothetical protein
MHDVIANERKFAVNEMLMDPIINRFIKNACVEGKEKLGKGVRPFLEEKEK